MGTIVVNSESGINLQTLSCELFRDWGSEIGVDAATTAQVMEYHAEQFISGVKTEDVDFDGLPDILGPRDFGAKWTNYCVWLFDPNQGRFIRNELSHQMEDLGNLTVKSERHQIISFTIGPTFPMRDEYNIDSRSAFPNGHSYRRLVPARSCVLDTGATAGAARTATVVTYVRGREVVQRRTVSFECNDVCGDGCAVAPASRR